MADLRDARCPECKRPFVLSGDELPEHRAPVPPPSTYSDGPPCPGRDPEWLP